MTTPGTHEQRASRACQECRTSKTRCIWPADMGVGKCRRCSRSKRVCTFMEPGTTRRAYSSRVGQLEEKIDGIVSLLHTSRQLSNATPILTPPAQQHSIQLPSVSLTLPTADSSHIRPSLAPPSPMGSESLSTHDTPPAFDYVEIIPGFRVTFGEADKFLHLYRGSFSPDFPFVPLPQTTTAYELYSNQPLLFRVVMHVVAPQTQRMQLEFAHWFRDYIARHVVMGQEKRLEILQAIVLYIAWADFRFYRGSEATNLLQLAIGQVIDLGLSQPAKGPVAPAISLNEAIHSHGFKLPPKQGLEHMRSMLGCFFLCASISHLFRRMSQFPYTNYLTTCCAELCAAQEYESDQFLVALIRMQRLVGRIRTAMPSPEIDGIDTVNFSTSLYMTMSTIRNELESLKSELPRGLQDSAIFTMNFRGILMTLHEPAIYTRTSLASNDGADSSHRTEALWRCLETIKQFFEAFLEIPVEKFPYLPFPAIGQLSFSINTAIWLLFLHDSDWDVQMARKSLDFAGLVDRMGIRYEESERVGIAEQLIKKRKFWDENLSMSMRYRDKMRWVKSWYLSKVIPTPEPFMGLGEIDADLFRQVDFISADSLGPAFWEALMNEDIGVAPRVEIQ